MTSGADRASQLKRPWPDGRTHLVLESVAFLRRLVGIIPPPRRHLVRYAGIFGPASKARAKLRALVPATDDTAHAACPRQQRVPDAVVKAMAGRSAPRSCSVARTSSSAVRRLSGPQCRRLLRSPMAAVSTANTGQYFERSWNSQPFTAAEVLEVVGVYDHTFLEVLEEAGGTRLVLIKERGYERTAVADVPAGLEESRLRRIRRGVIGGAVAAFAPASGALAHSQADEQNEQVAQGIGAAPVVVRPSAWNWS
jgi:hypothetical protein